MRCLGYMRGRFGGMGRRVVDTRDDLVLWSRTGDAVIRRNMDRLEYFS